MKPKETIERLAIEGNKTRKIALGWLIAGGICLLIAPILFSRHGGLFSFQDTGEIGDTIGGITAPITGFLGAYLVYLALRAQIIANNIIIEQFNEQKLAEYNHKKFEIINSQITSLNDEINNLSYRSIRNNRTIDVKGSAAINELLLTGSQLQGRKPEDIYDVLPGLVILRILLNRIVKFKELLQLEEIEEEVKLNDSIDFIYSVKIKPFLIKYEHIRANKQAENQDIFCIYGIPEDIYEIYDLLISKYNL